MNRSRNRPKRPLTAYTIRQLNKLAAEGRVLVNWNDMWIRIDRLKRTTRGEYNDLVGIEGFDDSQSASDEIIAISTNTQYETIALEECEELAVVSNVRVI